MRAPSKNIWGNVFLSLMAVILFFAVMEGVLRLTVYNFKNYPISPGPNSAYPVETDEFRTLVTTNSLNMRDAEIVSKQPGEYRILCLGDSFTFGLGVNVPEAYPKVLERLLREKKSNISVINGGTAGNAEDAYHFLVDKGLGFSPDLVTVQIYIGNDFYDGMTRLNDSAGPAGGQPHEPQVDSLRPTGRPRPPSPAELFKARIRGLRLRTVEFLWTRLVQVPWIDDWLYQMNLRYDNRGIFLRKYPELEQRLVEMELEALARIWIQCRKQNIRLAVIIVPTKQQLFKKHFLDNGKYDYRKPNRLLNEFCLSHGISVLDFLELFESRPEKELKKFYYVKDRHWTVSAHVFAAVALEDFIKKNFGDSHSTFD